MIIKTIRHLIDLEIKLEGNVIDPCANDHDVVFVLDHLKNINLHTNDLNQKLVAHTHFDMTEEFNWQEASDWSEIDGNFDWVVGKPPYGEACNDIVFNGVKHAKKGCIFFLKLDWLKYRKKTISFIKKYPPNHLIIYPSYRFKKNKESIAAYVWLKDDKDGLTNIEHYSPKHMVLYHKNYKDEPCTGLVIKEVMRLNKLMSWF